jgi:hypothetical protein
MKGFIGGIPVALLAVAAQAKFAERVRHLPLEYTETSANLGYSRRMTSIPRLVVPPLVGLLAMMATVTSILRLVLPSSVGLLAIMLTASSAPTRLISRPIPRSTSGKRMTTLSS